MLDDARGFDESLPILTDFAAAVKAVSYRPLPDGWTLGFADVVGSTQAIAEGRYKAVNFVAAGVVASVSNALDRRPFLSSLAATARASRSRRRRGCGRRGASGDGGARARASSISICASRWSPVGAIRAAGREVGVARFAAAQPCDYAMFAGGGMTWFDEEAKRGASRSAPRRPARGPISRVFPAAGAWPGEARTCSVADRLPERRRPALSGPLVEEIVALAVEAAAEWAAVTLDQLAIGRSCTGDRVRGRGLTRPASGTRRARRKAAASYAARPRVHRLQAQGRRFRRDAIRGRRRCQRRLPQIR